MDFIYISFKYVGSRTCRAGHLWKQEEAVHLWLGSLFISDVYCALWSFKRSASCCPEEGSVNLALAHWWISGCDANALIWMVRVYKMDCCMLPTIISFLYCILIEVKTPLTCECILQKRESQLPGPDYFVYTLSASFLLLLNSLTQIMLSKSCNPGISRLLGLI